MEDLLTVMDNVRLLPLVSILSSGLHKNWNLEITVFLCLCQYNDVTVFNCKLYLIEEYNRDCLQTYAVM